MAETAVSPFTMFSASITCTVISFFFGCPPRSLVCSIPVDVGAFGASENALEMWERVAVQSQTWLCLLGCAVASMRNVLTKCSSLTYTAALRR